MRSSLRPGRPYQMTTAAVDGTEFRVFANAPENLCELYRSGLEFADRDFFVYQGERYSYQASWRLAAQVANQLLARGVKPGDRVGIALRNYPEWIWAFMGITSAGAIAVAMNAWWSGEELVYGVEDSGLDLLFVDRERLERVTPFLDRLEIDLVTVRCQSEEHPDWASFLEDASAEMPELGIAPDTNALIMYTSGYTSRPKGVLSTHRAIIHALLGWESVIALAAERSPGRIEDGPDGSIVHVAGRAALSCERAARAAAVLLPPGTQAGGYVQVGCRRSPPAHRSRSRSPLFRACPPWPGR